MLNTDSQPAPPASGQDERSGSAQKRDAGKSVRERIRWAILKRIANGEYQPGERLKEMALAREFDVSQAPVREVFRELEALGVLVSERYRGTRVRAITGQEMREVYQTRGFLEEIAAQLIPSIRSEDLEAVDASQRQMRHASQTGNAEAFIQGNFEFHRRIVSMSQNQVLLRIWESLEVGMRSRLNLHKNEEMYLSLSEIHQPIVDALSNGDRQLAGRLLREHSLSFLQDLP